MLALPIYASLCFSLSMHRLILASASPRRKFLLEKAGFTFSVFPSHVSENPNKNISIDEQILEIAERKARASFDIINSNKQISQPFVVLAVDTEVIIDQKLIGKPNDRQDAFRILSLLSGRTHEVKSGVVLLDSQTQKIVSQIETAKIQFKPLAPEEIENYLNLNEYQDKAGAYAMQGEGQKLIAQFQGNWDNIVGLPIGLFKNLLKELQIEVETNLVFIQRQLKEILKEKPLPKIIAVSKFQNSEKIRRLISWGQLDFGENYIQEAHQKVIEFKEFSLNWHFIGRIQKNKIKNLIEDFNFIHTLSSLETARALNLALEKENKTMKVLFQVNLSGEESKSGYIKKDLLNDWLQLVELKNLKIHGLMTMPPLFDDPELNRPYFKELRMLLLNLKEKSPENIAKQLTELSMGTSHDYLVAAQEGATMIRLGTVLFGERESQ